MTSRLTDGTGRPAAESVTIPTMRPVCAPRARAEHAKRRNARTTGLEARWTRSTGWVTIDLQRDREFGSPCRHWQAMVRTLGVGLVRRGLTRGECGEARLRVATPQDRWDAL